MTRLMLFALAASMAWTAQGVRPFIKGLDNPRHHAPPAAAYAPLRAAESSTLLEEDFSNFSGGSVTDPADEISYENGYYIPASMTLYPGWTGQGVRPAGGCVSLHPWEDSYGGQRGGYISTPKMMLDGTAIITFKAKAADRYAELWVALCDDNYGPGEDSFDLELSEQWEQFSLTASNGDLEIPSYFQFMAEEGLVLLDDIKVEFRRDRIATPYPLNAINISTTEFVAQWTPVSGADAYLLTVLSKRQPENMAIGSIEENFDAISLLPKGGRIDTANPNYPEGWMIDVSSNGTQDVAIDPEFMSSSPIALMFDAVGDIIESPETPEPLEKFSFWGRPTLYQDEYSYMSLIRVEIYHSLTDKWENVAHLAYYNFPAEGGLYTLDETALGTDVTRIRLSYIQKGMTDFYIDDLKLDYRTQGITEPLFEDLRVGDTSYTVSGCNPENEYNYYVKALRDDIVSPASSLIWVDGISGLKTETLEPDDISPDSFTARWKRLGHASAYTVNLYSILSPETEMKDVTVLEEDFENIDQGTPEQPGMDWISPIDFSERGWAATGWSATQPSWIKGMVGTTGTNFWMGVAGLVYTPVLDLSCHDGSGINVEGKFFTTVPGFDYEGEYESEGIFAIIMHPSDMTTPIASAFIDTPVAGDNEGKMTISNIPADTNLSEVVIAFMNKSGLAFYVDYARISMNVPAGKALAAPLLTANTDDTSYRFDNLDNNADHAFTVTASATHNYETFRSEISDMRHVPTSTSGIDDVADAITGQVTIYGERGSLNVSAPDDIQCDIFTTSGVMILSANGSFSTQLPSSIYLVRADGKTCKVMVK